jgi:hypothetical protein
VSFLSLSLRKKNTHSTFQRVNNWFKSRANTNAGNGSSRKDNIMNLTKAKGSRRETAYHTFYRLGGNELRDETKKDYEQYKANCEAAGIKPIPVAARRNQFLAEHLKKQPKEVQDKIEAARLDAGADGAAKKFSKVFDVNAMSTEEERLENARKLQM